MPEHTHPPLAPLQQSTVKYRPDDEVDFVIVGSGAAGGVVAKELSTAGFRVVVLEQGPWRTERDFVHDEIKIFDQSALSNNWELSPNTFRKTTKDKAQKQPSLIYARGVGRRQRFERRGLRGVEAGGEHVSSRRRKPHARRRRAGERHEFSARNIRHKPPLRGPEDVV